MLKTDFHMHTAEDPIDFHIKYSARDLIKHCAKLGYEVLSITNHAFKPKHKPLFNKDLERFAKKNGILLIPGMEARIDNKDVVILNIKESTKKPMTFRRLEMLKKEGAFLIAPHPMYKLHSLNKFIFKTIDLFDAIEYSHSYTKYFNLNKWAMEIADEYNKPVVGTSDCHFLQQLNKTYTMVDADLNKDSVLEAIRKKKIKLVTRPLTTFEFASIMSKMTFKDIFLKTFFYAEGNGYHK
ncbi:MAG: PHP domain-containing protein [Nanoarchaeota archaeon]|nr:PHP domain-containing protein [Nanoarchaeota archaeon]